MTDTIRDLLISLASHMAYMQGQLEALHELSDPEDYYWYRKSVLLRQKVTDALADEPAPEGREPVSFTGRFTFPATGQPSDEQLLDTLDRATADFPPRHPEAEGLNAVEYPLALELRKARAVLARWGNRQGSLDSSAPQPPAEGEVAKLVQLLRHAAEVDGWDGASPEWCQSMLRAADLLQRLSPPQPVPVSERLPGPEDCNAEWRCWWAHEADKDIGIAGKWVLLRFRGKATVYTHWLPAHALPLPGQEAER